MSPVSVSFPDFGDGVFTNLSFSEVRDQLDVMRHQEDTTYKCCDYIAKNTKSTRFTRNPVDPKCRAKMCGWCYQIVDRCNLQRETVSQAFSYLDRYLCTKHGRIALCDRSVYQIAVMTALCIAAKVHETSVIGMDLLEKLSANTYSKKDFERMETRMLNGLEFRLNGPIPLSFIRLFIVVHESLNTKMKDAILEAAQYQVELAVSEYSFVGYRSSQIAFAAILNAVAGIDDSVLLWNAKQIFIGKVEEVACLTAKDVLPIQTALSSMLKREFSAIEEAGVAKKDAVSKTCKLSHDIPLPTPNSPVSIAVR